MLYDIIIAPKCQNRLSVSKNKQNDIFAYFCTSKFMKIISNFKIHFHLFSFLQRYISFFYGKNLTTNCFDNRLRVQKYFLSDPLEKQNRNPEIEIRKSTCDHQKWNNKKRIE